MSNRKKKPGKYKQKNKTRKNQLKKGDRKGIKKQTNCIQSPYATLLCCKGLAQQNLKHN